MEIWLSGPGVGAGAGCGPARAGRAASGKTEAAAIRTTETPGFIAFKVYGRLPFGRLPFAARRVYATVRRKGGDEGPASS